MDQVITDAILDYQNNMKPYLDKQGLDTLATEIKNKFISTPALGNPQSILTLDKNSVIRWNSLIGVLKYRGLLNSVAELPSVESANLGDVYGVKESSNEEDQQILYVVTYKPLQGEETKIQKQWMPLFNPGEFTYTNLTATPKALGGIPQGTTFKNVDLQSLFDMLLYPYINPTASLTVSPTEFEYGVETTLTFTISGKDGTNSIQHYYIDGTEITTANKTYTVEGATSDTTKTGYVVDSNNISSNIASAKSTAKYRVKLFAGTSDETIGVSTLDNASLRDNGKLGNQTITVDPANNKIYVYFILPTSLWNGVKVKTDMGAIFTDYTVKGTFTRNGLEYSVIKFNNEYQTNPTFKFE